MKTETEIEVWSACAMYREGLCSVEQLVGIIGTLSTHGNPIAFQWMSNLIEAKRRVQKPAPTTEEKRYMGLE